jgi:hypothetical protein
MDLQQRRHDQRTTPQAASSPAGGGPGLDQARLQAQRLLDAADAAITRALSGNAEAFLAASRQQGGQ